MILPLIRLQIRCPSVTSVSQRSGALVFDLHDVELSTASLPSRFETSETITKSQANIDVLYFVECRRIVIASSLPGESKAIAVISLGPFAQTTDLPRPPQSFSVAAASLYTVAEATVPSSHLRLSLRKVHHPVDHRDHTHTPGASMVLSADVPSVHAHLHKTTVDAIQYWVDDVSQLIQRTFGSALGDGEADLDESRETSLIGSRFFVKSLWGKSSDSAGSTMPPSDIGSEIVVKATISEGQLDASLLSRQR